jgi:hypothetical protein
MQATKKAQQKKKPKIRAGKGGSPEAQSASNKLARWPSRK